MPLLPFTLTIMLMLMRHTKSGDWTKESTTWAVLFYMAWLGKLVTFFPFFFFFFFCGYIHLHDFMHKVFVFKEGRVRVKRLVAYGNYFKKKKIIFYYVKITRESHNFSLKLAYIVCVRNIALYVISITLLYSNDR